MEENFSFDSQYYNRIVTNAEPGKDFEKQKNKGLTILEKIIRSFDENLDLSPESINKVIENKKKIQEKSEKDREKFTSKDPAERIALNRILEDEKIRENQIKVLEDYNKLKSVKLLSIPEAKNEYFAIEEEIGGVTEKVSLCRRKSVEESLQNLIQFDRDFQNQPIVDESTFLEEYSQKRDDYKLSPNGMLKLPKKEKNTEVLREGIALSISKNMGFTTAEFSTVTYEGKPALFIPFSKIDLMKDFSKGTIFRKGSEKEYSHYSVISPVGEGNLPNTVIEGFGNKLAFFYLCNDPDAFGGYNQNKALTEGKKFFVFDQVLFGKNFFGVDHFILDSRCSLVPNPDSPMRHSRHFQGRNRTLVDDSPLSEKLDSLFNMVEQKEKILNMIEWDVVTEYRYQMQNLENEGKKDTPEYQTVKELHDDAKANKAVVERRIDHVFDHFLQYNGQNITKALNRAKTPEEKSEIKETIRHALFLEKMVNNPRLYTDDGRPYRNPWTYHKNPITNRDMNRIENIRTVRDENGEEKYEIRFSDIPSKSLLSQICKQCGDYDENGKKQGITIGREGSIIYIAKNDLKKIEENSLFPEAKGQFDLKENYLDPKRLEVLMNSYDKGYRQKTLKLIQKYDDLKNLNLSPERSIKLMMETLNEVKKINARALERGFDQGFTKHVIRNLNFEIQQTLQKLVSNDLEMKPLIEKAFESAIKLDRVEDFNRMLMLEMQNRTNNEFTPKFKEFLKQYQALDKDMGHQQALSKSEGFSQSSQMIQQEHMLKQSLFKGLSEFVLGVDQDKFKDAFQTASSLNQLDSFKTTMEAMIKVAKLDYEYGIDKGPDSFNRFFDNCQKLKLEENQLKDPEKIEKNSKQFALIIEDTKHDLSHSLQQSKELVRKGTVTKRDEQDNVDDSTQYFKNFH